MRLTVLHLDGEGVGAGWPCTRGAERETTAVARVLAAAVRRLLCAAIGEAPTAPRRTRERTIRDGRMGCSIIWCELYRKSLNGS
jgi:hypothetical protein